MREPAALLSVRPRFAEALLSGSKTVEIRRRRVNLTGGAICLLYASTPVRALVGALSIEATDTDRPATLWDRWGENTGLSREEYENYLEGSDRACAIIVSATVVFPQAIQLAELRRRHSAFVTPQSYRFLGTSELSSILNGEARYLAALSTKPTRPKGLGAIR
jgi:predicted transcriptional regulator